MSERNDTHFPLVSITMAAYNHERYVQQAIKSVIDQDYPRIELLVIDDGSSDSTWEKIEAMRPICEKRFERVVLKTHKNCGCVKTWRELHELAQGEYVGGLASDDCYLPGAIRNLIRPMLEDESIGITLGTNVIMDSNGVRCYWDRNHDNVYDEKLAAYKTFDQFVEHLSGIGVNSPLFGTYAGFVKSNHLCNGHLERQSVCRKIGFGDDRAPLEDLWYNLQGAKITRIKHVGVETFAYRWHGANTAARGAYMCRIINQTLERELECLERGDDTSEWAQTFLRVRPSLNTVVASVRLGSHRPRLVRVRSWRHIQYQLIISSFVIPLTPKMKVKIQD